MYTKDRDSSMTEEKVRN